MNRPGAVQSVARAAALLRALGAAPGGLSATDASVVCGLNRATAWRILATLQDEGLVVQDLGTLRFHLGFGIAQLADNAGVESLANRAQQALQRLSAQTGETASLAIPDGLGIRYVTEVRPGSAVSASWLGDSVPLHATSTGKAMIAHWDASARHRLFEDGLRPYTDTTLDDPDKLEVELAGVRRFGYAVCRGEYDAHAWGVSSPVLDHGRVLGVLSLWGPSDRLTEDRFTALGELLVREVPSLLNPGRDGSGQTAHSRGLQCRPNVAQ